MGQIYHKKLGMIKDTPENRALFPKKKVKKKKDDTTKAGKSKQDSTDVDGVGESITTK